MDSSTRQEHIRAASSFLKNPNLDSPLKDRLQFLKDKGLSELEIQEALDLALTSRPSVTNGKWNFFIVFSMCIIGYKLYKTYLDWRQASGSTKKEKNESTKTKELESDSEDEDEDEPAYQPSKIEESMDKIESKLSELTGQIERQGTMLSDELLSLKKMLVSPEKFPSPPIIPAWQLAKKEDSEANQDDDTKQKNVSETPQ